MQHTRNKLAILIKSRNPPEIELFWTHQGKGRWKTRENNFSKEFIRNLIEGIKLRNVVRTLDEHLRGGGCLEDYH